MPKREMFNGKPMSYWQFLADDAVISILLKGIHNCDQRSIIGKLASKELMRMAMEFNPTLTKQITEQHDAIMKNMMVALSNCLPDVKTRQVKKPDRRKVTARRTADKLKAKLVAQNRKLLPAPELPSVGVLDDGK